MAAAAVFTRGLPLDERQSAAELDAVLQHHNNLQEKLAEDMLHLARNLKNNTMAAQNIIKQDNQVGHLTLTPPDPTRIKHEPVLMLWWLCGNCLFAVRGPVFYHQVWL